MIPDIGYHHVQTYHFWLELQTTKLIAELKRCTPPTVESRGDFDFETEQREGWSL